MTVLHSLLRRQMKRHFGSSDAIPAELCEFLSMVNDAYHQSDSDRSMLERSLELTSQELMMANAEVRAVFARLISSSVDGIMAFDCDCCYTVWNPGMEYLSGIKAIDILGKCAFDAFPYLQEFGENQFYLAALAGSTIVVKDHPYTVRQTNMPGFFEGHYAPLLSEENQIIGGLAIIRDVSERKRAEAELRSAKTAAEAANRAKSSFLANMSHELRTPLTAMLGYAALIELEATTHGYMHLLPDIARIQVAGQHLTELITDILDLSKIEAGKMNLCLETFDAAMLIEDVVITIQPLVAKNTNELDVIYPNDLGSLYADQIKVRQVLLNLLSNACKFTQRGRITLTVTRMQYEGEDWITFAVADTGIGIAAEHMDGLFLPFTQVDGSATRKYGGTGLGLAISDLFCQLMGGDISVTSVEGRGTTFTVRLPTAVAPGEAEQIGTLEAVHGATRYGSQ